MQIIKGTLIAYILPENSLKYGITCLEESYQEKKSPLNNPDLWSLAAEGREGQEAGEI